MISKLMSVLRDIALFCALIALVKIALNDTVSYVLEHKKSLIHELDRTFIDHLYTAQRHVHYLEEHPDSSDNFSITLAELKSKLATIEEQYKKNSPGLALLGPIGTAAIVTKEEQLAKKLLVVVNDIGALLHQNLQADESFTPAATISAGLTHNKQIIKTLYT